VAWLPWLLGRLIVGAALGLARYERSHLAIGSARAIAASHEGLFSWDAGWYRAIAEQGYAGAGRSSLRFFPLYPELGSLAHATLRAPVGVTLLLVANLASLLAAMGLYLLTRHELDRSAARRATWLLCLSPASFVLAMGYAEALFVLLAIFVLFAARTERWWLAAGAGLLAGLTRPLGLLLAIFVLVEAVRRWRAGSTRSRTGSVVAVLGPLAGAGVFMAWVADAYGDLLLPFRLQTDAGHHGGFGDPFTVVWHAATEVLHGHVGTALHVPWIGLALVLLVVALFRLPVSYGLFAAAVLLTALSGQNLDSFERYALSALPLVMAGGTLLRSERVATSAFTLLGVAMFAYASLAFLGAYVP
jgi:hypothetical protein